MLLPRQHLELGRGGKDKEHAMSEKLSAAIPVIGIGIGKSSFHMVGLNERSVIKLRQKWSRGQLGNAARQPAAWTDRDGGLY